MAKILVKNTIRPIVVTFFAAWLLRLGIAWFSGSFHNFDRRDMERLALAVAQTGTMSNMMVPGLPTAGEAPGYVLFLAGLFHFLGTGALAEAVKVFACTAASALRCALTVWLVSRMQLGKAVLIATAVFALFWIGALNTELQGDWDPPYTSVALILLVAFHESRLFEQRSPQQATLLGALWALCAYLNFSILAIMGGFLFRDLVFRGRYNFRAFFRHSICVAAGVFIVLLPWGVRNKSVLGEWIFSRTMFGYGLALSYHDGAHWGEPANNHPGRLLPGHPDDLSLSPYPFLNASLRPDVAKLGEVEWDRQERRKGLNWVAAHPARSLILFAQHTFYFWFPPGADFYYNLPMAAVWCYAIVKWSLTLLALAGWLRLRRLAWPAAETLAVILLFFPLVYYVVNWSSRYRMPIEWVLVLLAGVALGGIYDTFLASHRTSN